jgi:hypothetical protein
MTPKSKRTHIEDIEISLGDPRAVEQFSAARRFLQAHLVVRRDLPNGKDFLFAGEAGELQQALKDLVAIEHRASRFLLVDFAKIDDYFLLRVVAKSEYIGMIETYFD